MRYDTEDTLKRHLANEYIIKSLFFYVLNVVLADGNYLLTCGSDKSLKLWSVSRGTLLKTYTGHGYEVLDVDRYVSAFRYTKIPSLSCLVCVNFTYFSQFLRQQSAVLL